MHYVLCVEQLQATCYVPQQVQEPQHVLFIVLWVQLSCLPGQGTPATRMTVEYNASVHDE